MSDLTQRRGRGWFWFWLLLTLLFLVFCVWHSTSNSFTNSIPNNVDRRVGSILAGTPLADKYRIDGRDVIFEGDVSDTVDVNGLLQRVQDDPSTQQIRRNDLNILASTPPAFVMESGDNGISLAGKLPDQASVDSALEAVEGAFPGQPITNNLEVDGSVRPQPWMAGLGSFMPNLAEVRSPGMKAEGDRVELFGSVDDDDQATRVNNSASQAFGNAVAVRNDFSVASVREPAQLSFARDGDKVMLGGRVPDQTSSDNLMGAAASIFGGDNITNEMVVDGNTQDADWINRGSSLFATLDGLENGRAQINGSELSVSGVVRSPEARESVISTLGASADNLTIVDEKISVHVSEPAVLNVEQVADGSIVLEGRVGSQEQADNVLQAATASYGDVPITNNLEVSNDVGEAPWSESLGNTMASLRGVENGSLSIGAGNIEVAGTVSTQAASDAVAEAAGFIADLPVDNKINVVALDQARVSMQRNESGIAISGVVPDEAARDAVTASAQQSFAGADINIDNLVVGDRVADAAWISSLPTAMAGVNDVEQMRATVSDAGVTVAGVVDSDDKRDAAANAMSLLGITPVENQIQVIGRDNASLQVGLPASAGSPVIVGGSMPGSQAIDDVRSQIASALPGASIDNRMSVGGRVGAAAWTENGLSELVGAYQGAEEARFSIADERITLNGTVTESSRSDIVAAAQRLNLSAGIDDQLVIKQIDVAQKLQSLDVGDIKFKHNSDELTPASVRILDSVVEVLNSAPAVRVEIGGHTDSVGPDIYNQDLSQRRSESVRRYLIDKGIADSRLTAKGYGEASPIAANTTAAGRAQNRRIEFVVQP